MCAASAKRSITFSKDERGVSVVSGFSRTGRMTGCPRRGDACKTPADVQSDVHSIDEEPHFLSIGFPRVNRLPDFASSFQSCASFSLGFSPCRLAHRMASVLVPPRPHQRFNRRSRANRAAPSSGALNPTRAVGAAIEPADARDSIVRGGSMTCGCGELVFGWVLGVWLWYWRAESECAVLQP